jgi:DNA-binding NtrC family response regulator
MLYFPAVPDIAPAEAARPKEVADDLSGTETVLVVEDDPRLRVLDERILKRYGYRVLVAASAEDAVRIGADYPGPIDVILSDVIMPGGSVRTIGDWASEHRPETKIVYMSGYTDTAIVHHGVLEPGMNFLQKPFSPEALVRKIREVLP